MLDRVLPCYQLGNHSVHFLRKNDYVKVAR
jgi:hypothetical protein